MRPSAEVVGSRKFDDVACAKHVEEQVKGVRQFGCGCQAIQASGELAEQAEAGLYGVLTAEDEFCALRETEDGDPF